MTRSVWLLAAVLGSLTAEGARAQCVSRADVDSIGAPANWDCVSPRISANGRFLVFESGATNLVPNDSNVAFDVFLRDRLLGTTECLSLSLNGHTGNGQSTAPSVSADGSRVAFMSDAQDLIAHDANPVAPDIFVHDRTTGVTWLASLSTSNVQSNGVSYEPAISGNGRFVAFTSSATNLVAGDANQVQDVFLRDLVGGTTIRVSVGAGGVEADSWSGSAAVSENGRYVVFESVATNLVAGDTNNSRDIFVRDVQLGVTTRVSVSTGGQQGNATSLEPSISADGRRIVFISPASNLVPGDTNGKIDVFVRDLSTLTTTRASVTSLGLQSNDNSYVPQISPDGRWVVFESDANNLVPSDANSTMDVYLHDLATGATTLASVKSDGTQSAYGSSQPSLSSGGTFVAFASKGQFVPEKFGTITDVFVEANACDLTIYCTAKVNSQLCIPSIGATGTPHATGLDDFHVTASSVLSAKAGLLIFGLAPDSTPFANGWLCVAAPIQRSDVLIAGGDPTIDCSGTFDFAFTHNFMAQHGLGAGSTVYAQFWSRDTGWSKPDDVGLTDALRFEIAP